MISFIIIGRNEGWKLTKCFESVFKTVKENKLRVYEVIYVDSKSTDDSIARAKKFPEVKIYQITGICNAAIGRNIGAKEAKGDVLFFIDGDMEIQANFLSQVYHEKEGLKYDFVSGQWINYNYSSSGKLLSKEVYIPEKFADKNEFTTGGLFLIKRDIWYSVNGMKNKMRKSQDLDIALRLAKKGCFLLRKKELLAIHHTVPYNDKNRMWKLLFSGAELYRIVLLRDNFWNKYEWKLFIRGNYTFFILMISALLSLCLNSPIFLLIYIASVILRVVKRGERSFRLVLSRLIYIPVYEILFFFSFFLFWPRELIVEYERII
jgi:glycosyltransferase involved in cell wall biosynthesis